LNIAKNTLTDRLSLLVEYGLLEKRRLPDRPDIHEYRLTARGLDTFPYALSLMKWGDDWLAGKRGPPVYRTKPAEASCVPRRFARLANGK
jgi:DNA-binding HxlR family transcriptional regulator